MDAAQAVSAAAAAAGNAINSSSSRVFFFFTLFSSLICEFVVIADLLPYDLISR